MEVRADESWENLSEKLVIVIIEDFWEDFNEFESNWLEIMEASSNLSWFSKILIFKE